MALLVYVDDIVIASNCDDSVTAPKVFVNSQFKIKDFGTLGYFSVIKAVRTTHSIHIYQRKYALDILADSGILGSSSFLLTCLL